jgi:hypothetical protein
MGLKRCSGATAFAQPKIEVVPCPDCGTDVEVWSDEATGRCPNCSRTVIRTATQSCVDWCRYAKECLGDEKFRKYGEMKAALRKSALMQAVVAEAGPDAVLVAHTGRVLAYAELLLAEKPDADPNVVMAAAALRGLVRRKAEHGSAAEPDAEPGAEPEGVEAAMRIMKELGYPQGLMNEVRELVALSADAARRDTLHFKLLHDALLLAGSDASSSPVKRRAASPELLDALLTEAGRDAARRR